MRMVVIYNLVIRFYLLLVVAASPFNKKARLWRNGRKHWLANLKTRINSNDRYIWVHCSSLGEFEQGRPVIEALRRQYPDVKILLTFFSPSGYEVRKNYPEAHYVCYLPIDTRRNAIRFIRTVNPVAAVFVKYEFWYHYLNQLRAWGVPTYLISAIFRHDQVFFKPYGGWYREFLRNFNHLFVQNEHSKELLHGIGIENVTVAGDTRFDRVADVARATKDIPLLAEFAENAMVIIAGSTWPPDEELLMGYFGENYHRVKLIIAPHEIHEAEIEKLQAKAAVKSIRYTQPGETDPRQARLLIIDTIGILASAYRYGKIAYIGGGFGTGIHNTLEAATFGLPVVFGPNYQKFQEAKDLIAIGSGRSVSNAGELKQALDNLIANPDLLGQASLSAREYISKKTGATGIICQKMELKK